MMNKRALLSVSDKKGIVEFAKGLSELGFAIISTGGTARTIQEAGIEVLQASQVTGFPEVLDGRVKTLHPHIHAGILAKGSPEHLEQLKKLQIEPIDLVVVNLYPFRETIAKPGVTLEDAIENIDIGGPTMVRSAAKNYDRVAVVVNPDHYMEIIEEIKAAGEISFATRQKLALEAFSHTASYDMAISRYLSEIVTPGEFPAEWFLGGEKVQALRYGENPHQKAAFYKYPGNNPGTLAGAKQLQGKELSYNNLVDVQAAWAIAQEFSEPAAAVIKHTNPCGTAVASDLHTAYVRAFAGDPISAYGGIIGLNGTLDEKTAQEISKTFVEAVIAPAFSKEALEILGKKKNLRLIEMGTAEQKNKEYWLEPVSGGFLVQDLDKGAVTAEELRVVTKKTPDKETIEELLFAWKVVKHVKSNAIVLTRDKQSVGVGAGQMNRVGAANIALEQAQDKAQGAVLASDAYFPFGDTVEQAAKHGVKAVIQPGGSIRDEESIKKADEYGIAMVFTGMRHFKH